MFGKSWVVSASTRDLYKASLAESAPFTLPVTVSLHGQTFTVGMRVDGKGANFAVPFGKDAATACLQSSLDLLTEWAMVGQGSERSLPLMWLEDAKQVDELPRFAQRVVDAFNDPAFVAWHVMDIGGVGLMIEADWASEAELDDRYGPELSIPEAESLKSGDRFDVNFESSARIFITADSVMSMLGRVVAESDDVRSVVVAGLAVADHAEPRVGKVVHVKDGGCAMTSVLRIAADGSSVDTYGEAFLLHPRIVSGIEGLKAGDVVRLTSAKRGWDTAALEVDPEVLKRFACDEEDVVAEDPDAEVPATKPTPRGELIVLGANGYLQVDWAAVCEALVEVIGCPKDVGDVVLDPPPEDERGRVRREARLAQEEDEANNLFSDYPELAKHLSKWQLYLLWDGFSEDYYKMSWGRTEMGRDSLFLCHALGLALSKNMPARSTSYTAVGVEALAQAGVRA